MTSRPVSPALRVEGEIQVPGDKSISHRALFVAAIAEGSTTITGLSPADDVASTLRMVAALLGRGDAIQRRKDRPHSEGKQEVETSVPSRMHRDFQIVVHSPGRLEWTDPQGTLDVGNSGSTIRMGLGALAPSRARAELTGDSSILRRPMRRVVDPLRRMGASIDGADGGEHAPLRIEGSPLRGQDFELAVASAQVKSAILLAALDADGITSVVEPAVSRDHTERMLKYMDASIDLSIKRSVVMTSRLHGRDLAVPGDLSSAAFFLVAAAILPGSRVTVTNVGLNPTRTGILDILRMFGADVEATVTEDRCGEPWGNVTVAAADRRPFEVSGALTVAALDELPLVGVLGAFAEGGVTTVRDAAELRVKESDRIASIADGLTRMGVDVETLPDGFAVRGGRPEGAEIDPAGDHRIAMAMAVAALGARGDSVIHNWDCVGVSYPGFASDLDAVAVR